MMTVNINTEPHIKNGTRSSAGTGFTISSSIFYVSLAKGCLFTRSLTDETIVRPGMAA